jgi:type II secretory pathway pseudopilin PulG
MKAPASPQSYRPKQTQARYGLRISPLVLFLDAFSLVELLVVMFIVALLTLLVVPAFTNIKGAVDVTGGGYTIKGILEQARSYAMAKNTYTWVGFAGSVGTTVTGQVLIATVASNDGTAKVCQGGDGTDTTNQTSMVVGTGPGAVTQLGKLARLDNSHIGDTGVPTNNGTDFENRPSVPSVYRVSASGDTTHPFTVQNTTFNRWIQFNPRGEAVVKGGATQVAQYAEVGLLPARGTTLVPPNIVAIQISGYEGNIRIYRR